MSSWRLSQEAFDKLLGLLDPDRDQAGQVYETLRRKLIFVLECRGASQPDRLADAVFDRVARRVEEGVQVQPESVFSYFLRVALHVLQEDRRASSRPLAPPPPVDPPNEALLGWLDAAVQKLPAEEREIVVLYYEGTKVKWSRAALAAKLHLTPNALRIRASRIRERLREMFLVECHQRMEG